MSCEGKSMLSFSGSIVSNGNRMIKGLESTTFAPNISVKELSYKNVEKTADLKTSWVRNALRYVILSFYYLT
jgi:hypothetical protein